MRRYTLRWTLALAIRSALPSRGVVSLGLLLAGGAASADPLAVKVVVRPKEQIRVDLPTAEKHFVLAVKREGKAEGTGTLAGAELTEYATHDIRPGLDGTARGYFVAKAAQGEAVLQWEIQVTFVPGPDGKSRLLDNGTWRLVGGTGAFAALRGAGTVHIRMVSPTDREFELTGELVPSRT